MCGIVGFIQDKAQTPLELIARMTEALKHRGPDDSGIWTDTSQGLALGHRRLSIIDVSPEGHQPMFSASGRYVIVFNGEIYNFQELRTALTARGRRFRGGSDTEVLLASLEEDGVAETLPKLVGMFAFAVWDKEQKTLTLARDRLGEKPLYYGVNRGIFFFSSELKALRVHPAFKPSINRGAVALLMRHCYIPSPHSIYEGVRKLPPASFITLSKDDILGAVSLYTPEYDGIQPRYYWTAKSVYEKGQEKRFQGTLAEATEQLRSLLASSVRMQMVSDVPLGAFLSGGIDSSLIVALMQSQSSVPVRTFSIGFHEGAFNEAPYAKRIAEHLGTNHTELYVTPNDALALVPRLPEMYDEPFADSSQIPTHLLARLTREHVTVSLSGDGGDELFGGYSWYPRAERIWRVIEKFPFAARNAAAPCAQAGGAALAPCLGAAPGSLSYRLSRLGEVLGLRRFEAFYNHLNVHWTGLEIVNDLESLPLSFISNPDNWTNGGTPAERMMYLDSQSYLPDDIMVKVDRATMAASLESRAPFLDHRVVELAWQLPPEMRVAGKPGKVILRKLLKKFVPEAFFERRKMGFGIPLAEWLRGPLRQWADDLLERDRLVAEGLLNADLIQARWNDHRSGRQNWHYHLWEVLMFQSWRQQNYG